MMRVLLLASAIASFMGSSLDRDWACWEDLWRTGQQYVCEYQPTQPSPISITVSADGDSTVSVIVR